MFNSNDTDCVPVRRSQVQPVTVISPRAEPMQTRLVRVTLLCGTTVSSNSFTTVAEIYQLVRSRLVCLQGPSWCRNHFRVEVSYRSRLLVDRNIDLVEYGVRDGDRIQVTVTGCLRGGAPSGVTVRGEYFPQVEDTWCARKKLRARQLTTFTRMSHEYLPTDRMRKTTKKKTRSLEDRAFDKFEAARLEVQASGDYLSMAQSFLTSLDNQFDTDFLKLMEDLLVFMMMLMRARAKADIMLAVLVFVKLRTNKALVSEALTNLSTLTDALFDDSPAVQATMEENVISFRDLLGKWDELRETTLGKKYSKLLRYLASYGVFSCVGVKPTLQNLRKSEDLGSTINHADFLYSVLDTCSFTLQRALMFARTGEWSVFLHGPKTYAAWYDKCLDIKRKAYSLGNLEAQGTDYFQFIATMKECIEEGQSIVKFASRDLKHELKAARVMLHEILLIEASVLTKKSAQEERRAPFAVLIHGQSSVAKSMFQKMLFYYYGKLMGLPTTSDYRYVRNPADAYWSGFSSQVWCIQMDDIGFLNPAKATEDLSLTELIAIVNNVPLVPNQADLADKGKTPVRARCVLASSNAKHLNASAYFFCPLAVQRRLPWVITVEPRPEFARSDAESMIDPMRMTSLDDDWPDFWTISVDKVVPGGKAGERDMAQFESVKKFSNTQDFLDWFGPVCKDFDRIQGKAMNDDIIMSTFDLCQICNKTAGKCECTRGLEVEARGEVMLPRNVTFGEDFYERYVEGSLTECRHYSFVNGAYMCYADTMRNNVVLRSYAAPVTVIEKVIVPENPAVSEYADVLNEMILRQRTASDSYVEKIACYVLNSALNVFLYFSPCPDTSGLKVEARNEVVLPNGVKFGEDFYERFVEGSLIENRQYTFVRDSYMCIVQVLKNGEELRSYAVPAIVVERIVEPVKVQASNVEYADILNEVISRQRVSADGFQERFVCRAVNMFLGAYIRFGFVRRLSDWLVSYWVVRAIVRRMIENYVPPRMMARQFFHFLGVISERVYTSKKWRKVILGVGVLSVSWMAYKRICNWSVQGGKMSVPDDHFSKNEKENVWKRDDYQTTNFDVDPISLNWKSLSVDQIVAKVRRNTARIFVSDGRQQIPGNAFCVGGHLWVTNNHILPEIDGDVTVDLRVDPLGQGTSRNVSFVLEQSQIYRENGGDLAYFEILAVDARPDLRKLVSRESLEGTFRAKYIGLNRDCSPKVVDVGAVVKTVAHCGDHNRSYTYWTGEVEQDTVNGDCGTPMVSFGPSVAILGLHQLGGSRNRVFAVKLTQSSLERAQMFFTRPVVQAGVPKISCSVNKKVLGPVGHRSPLRWLSAGSITTFGTFVGYQVRSRSKVCATMCGDYIKSVREWQIPFGRPDLKDWRPWHLAYKDVVEQQNILKTSILKKAVDGYVADVCAGLSESDKENLRIISDHAAINGIAGVQYIDKMNFNSSMGEPFNKSKKWFLEAAPTESQPLAKVFTTEVMERAADIEHRYRSGVRACPVFSGQLKDEARAESKIALGKIRVFTGAPVDWSLVVRKYLLSFVKVVQENRLLFEAAPGCVTQSLEWEQFRDYLVQHGVDQIVAGDYGKFDKKMTAQVILAAFDAIIAILKFAGWSAEDLLVVYGIAEDTAYSFVNCNGDLVMLYGSNPSGHPLTVIINSVVNALYMRYCFIVLSEDKQCTLFKKFVSLMTYGDDNVMGVCKSIPWFNHTAIVGVLKSIGVEYTMADKESKSVPYININDVSFLKRSWRWDEDVKAYLCPLEEQSIHKMLCINIPSGTISAEAQMIAEMNSAVREWFFYGRERFEKERAFLLEVIDKFELRPEYNLTPFPMWEELRDTFWRASSGMITERLGENNSHPVFTETVCF